MAATFRTSAAGGGTSGTGDRTVTFTPAVGDHITVWCSVSGNTEAGPTMTDNNGGTYTLVLQAFRNASADNSFLFVRDSAMPNTTSTIVTLNTNTNTAAQLVVIAYSGMSRFGTSSIRSSGKQENQASGGTPTPVLSQAALTANPTIWSCSSGDTTTTPNASWTERQDVSQSTPTTAIEVSTRDSGFTGTSVAAGATQSTVFSSMIVELDSSLGPAIGDLTATQAAQTLSAGDADVIAGATATPSQAADSITTDADVVAAATATVSQAANTPSADASVTSGASTVTGTLSVSQAANTASATGATTVAAQATVSQATQTSTTDADVVVSSSSTLTQAANTITAGGGVSVRGTATLTQAAQTVTTDADVTVAATSTVAQAAQTLAGTVATSVRANATPTQAAQTLSGAAIIGTLVAADLNTSQASQTTTGVGVVAIAASSTLAQANNTTTTATTIAVNASLAIAAAANTLTGSAASGVATIEIVAAVSSEGSDVVVLTSGSSVEV